MAQNKVSITIAGISLLVTTPEDEEYVLQLAREIDDYINAVLDKTPGASVTNAVLLCALEYLDEYKKANRTANNMRSQIKDYMAEAAGAKLQYDDEAKKVTDLEDEIQTLRAHLTRIASEGDASGVLEKMRQEAEQATAEIKRLRKQAEDLAEQNKALAEKSDAMNNYITDQDREIARLTAVNDEMALRLGDGSADVGDMAGRMAQYEGEIAGLLAETESLKQELDRLEDLLGAQQSGQVSLFAPPADVPVSDDDISNAQPSVNAPPDMPEDVSIADKPDSIETPDENAPDTDVIVGAALESFSSETSPVGGSSPFGLPLTDDFSSLSAPSIESSVTGDFMPPAPSDAISFNDAPSVQDLVGAIDQSLQDAPVAEPASAASDELDIPAFMDAPSRDLSPRANRDARIADFDIDISDMPHAAPPEAPSAPAGGDVFSEYQIDEDDTILGFGSVPRDRQAEDAEYRRMKEGTAAQHKSPEQVLDESPVASEHTGASDDVLQKVRQISSSIEAAEKEEFAAAPPADRPPEELEEPAQQEAPETKPEKKRRKKGKLEGLLNGDGSDNDDFPDLSWTLDI